METLYIVIPCYNEQEVLPETLRRLDAKLTALEADGRISPDSRVLLVDDGSRDRTWALIDEAARQQEWVEGIKLAHNRGHQNALLAGLMTAREHADIVVSMDADLQDDVDAIDGFLDQRAEGCDIVYGVRAARTTDTAFKRTTAEGYYKLLKLLGVEIVFNHADYRLMSRRALDALAEYHESNLFLRGIVPSLGFKTAEVTYERAARFAGESKYPLKKMLALAFEGVTSFSVKPLRLVTAIGVLLCVLAGLGLLAALIVLLCGLPVAGWVVVLGSVWLVGGLELIAIGLVGAYIGKIYGEVKARPRYILEENTLERRKS